MNKTVLMTGIVVSAILAQTPASRGDLKDMHMHNPYAYIPSQCWTKTVDEQGNKHNPCFACHISSVEPNYFDDTDLQEAYSFAESAIKNRWTNLFKDRTRTVESLSDKLIMDYVRVDNYKDKKGGLILTRNLQNLSKAWDMNDNGVWDGYRPDCYFDFDSRGFDKAPNGTYTGWRSFAYYPFLGTFWPTNGSTDDVLIRLQKPFQQDETGNWDKDVYSTNLAIVESLIKMQDIVLESPVDEKKLGVDLDHNGKLGMAKKVVYHFDGSKADNTMSYVGGAKKLLEEGLIHLAGGLYPEGVEFLHSVRYIDVDKAGNVSMAPRMKELRYGRKVSWRSYFELSSVVGREIKERHDFPERIRQVYGNMEMGVRNGQGWIYQGFIEDAKGELRPQTYEENVFCIGCHSNLGAIRDSTFVFQRKLDHRNFRGGWYHWSQKGIEDLKEPKNPNGDYEYTFYLKTNHAGDEFRGNEEVMQKFFDKDGELIQSEINKIHNDISYLLLPSKERALTLNKAYRAIVMEQSFIYGRDATFKPVPHVVHKEVEVEQNTELEAVIWKR